MKPIKQTAQSFFDDYSNDPTALLDKMMTKILMSGQNSDTALRVGGGMFIYNRIPALGLF